MAMIIKPASFKGLFFMTSATLIILKVIFFFVTYIPSNLMMTHEHGDHHFDLNPPFERSSEIFINTPVSILEDAVRVLHEEHTLSIDNKSGPSHEDGGGRLREVVHEGGQLSAGDSTSSKVKPLEVKEVYHEKDIFLDNYQQMNKTLKIYIYPHTKTDPFANIFLPDNHGSPGGNYASESYFKVALSMSHFVTQDPSKADLFFLPFSIASMRHDKRIGVGGIKTFMKDYIFNISHKYPFWNRTGGADHFYVACHSIGRTAMEKAPEVRINAIQVVCSSSYFLQGYTAHKDASIPQIWPRPGVRPTRHPSKRETLAFYAGAMNSRVRESLVKTWINDSEIRVHQNRLETPYSESLLGSKFCIHAKGFEVNTARIGDAIYYGCVPVVLADHYDLPFGDVLNWNSFSVVVSTEDIAFLKKILNKIVESDEYMKLHKNVVQVQRHFQWHEVPHKGKSTFLDLTGVSPLAGLRDSGFVPGQAVLRAESKKVAKHETSCLENQHVFIPFAFDTFGSLAPEAVRFLERVQKVVHSDSQSPRNQGFIFSRIGFAIQKGIAAQLVARLPIIQM